MFLLSCWFSDLTPLKKHEVNMENRHAAKNKNRRPNGSALQCSFSYRQENISKQFKRATSGWMTVIITQMRVQDQMIGIEENRNTMAKGTKSPPFSLHTAATITQVRRKRFANFKFLNVRTGQTFSWDRNLLRHFVHRFHLRHLMLHILHAWRCSESRVRQKCWINGDSASHQSCQHRNSEPPWCEGTFKTTSWSWLRLRSHQSYQFRRDSTGKWESTYWRDYIAECAWPSLVYWGPTIWWTTAMLRGMLD